jgi:hypothetical protein
MPRRTFRLTLAAILLTVTSVLAACPDCMPRGTRRPGN